MQTRSYVGLRDHKLERKKKMKKKRKMVG